MYKYSRVAWTSEKIGGEEELKKLQRKAIIEFYARPRIITKYLFKTILSYSKFCSFLRLLNSYIIYFIEKTSTG